MNEDDGKKPLSDKKIQNLFERKIPGTFKCLCML